MKLTLFFIFILVFSLFAQQKSELNIQHSMVISGPKTFEVNEKVEIVWEYEDNSRDMTGAIGVCPQDFRLVLYV